MGGVEVGWIHELPPVGTQLRGTEDWFPRGLAQATLRIQGWPPTQLRGSRLPNPPPCFSFARDYLVC